ncbi:major capsid protein [Pseudomonas sp. F1_0610]|uniref:major capsid protein n=1 Tax=Pseudomonas sp. F1_0610 TaxID=3114284 RepID=UPI0039C21B7D
MDIFDTRTMLEAVEQMHAPSTFLLRAFFNGSATFPTKTVDIDIVKGGRKLAPFINPQVSGGAEKRDGYKSSTYTPPYVKPKFVTTADQFFKRQAGQNPYATVSAAERAAQQLGKDLAELNNRITNREEWMAAKALTTGKIMVEGEGVKDEIDFLMPAENKIVLATKQWGSKDANPIENLRKWKRQAQQASGRSVTTAVLDAAAYDALLTTPSFLEQLNTRRIDLGFIKPEELPEGVTYIGYLNDPGLDLYAYDGSYIDDQTGNLTPYLDEGRVIMGPTVSANKRLYGAIQDLGAIEQGAIETARFPKTWIENDPSRRLLQVISAPLVALLEGNAFISAKVV